MGYRRLAEWHTYWNTSRTGSRDSVPPTPARPKPQQCRGVDTYWHGYTVAMAPTGPSRLARPLWRLGQPWCQPSASLGPLASSQVHVRAVPASHVSPHQDSQWQYLSDWLFKPCNRSDIGQNTWGGTFCTNEKTAWFIDENYTIKISGCMRRNTSLWKSAWAGIFTNTGGTFSPSNIQVKVESVTEFTVCLFKAPAHTNWNQHIDGKWKLLSVGYEGFLLNLREYLIVPKP